MAALTVSCNGLDADPAIVGSPYSHFVTASGGVPPYAFDLSAWPFGTVLVGMPGGFDPNTGEIFGTATVVTPPWNVGDTGHIYTFLIRVTDSAGTVVSIGCSLACYLTRPPIFISGNTPDGTTGTPYNGTISASGGQPPYTFSLTGPGALPPGLAMDSAGNITGTPTLNGIYSFEVTATGSGGGDNNETSNFFQIVVGGVSVDFGWQLYYYAYGFLGPLAIACGNPPDGVAGVAYAHSIALLPGGVAPYVFSISAGALPTGLTIDPDTGIISGTPTTVGIFPFTVQVVDAEATTETVDCSIEIFAPLTIICDNPPDGATGVPYAHTFPASGGVPPYTFSISVGSLPDGLTIDPATGIVSGTPTVAGTFVFTVHVVDSYLGSPDPNTADVQCSILITGDVSVSCNNPPTGRTGQFYEHDFIASGGTPAYVYTLALGTLPPGLTLDSATGELSGTPTLSGFYNFSIRATDATDSAGQVACSILIKRCLLVDLTS